MKEYKFFLLALSCAFFLVLSPYYAEGQKSETGDLTLQPAAKALQITGTVTSVNAAAGSIAVTKNKKTTVFMVKGKETKIMKAGEQKSLADIKAGDKAAVIYSKRGEMNLARTISIK